MLKPCITSAAILRDESLEEDFKMIKSTGFEYLDFNIDVYLPGSDIRDGNFTGLYSKSIDELKEFFKPHKELAEKYRHPLWKVAGDVARRIGGHWGGDTIMDLRWIYCLRNGLPMDMDVYDMAAWSCIFECTSKSMAARSSSVDIPDFTRGAWKTAAPFPPETFEPGKIDLRNIGNAGEQYRT